MRMPEPDQTALAKREAIVARLRRSCRATA